MTCIGISVTPTIHTYMCNTTQFISERLVCVQSVCVHSVCVQSVCMQSVCVHSVCVQSVCDCACSQCACSQCVCSQCATVRAVSVRAVSVRAVSVCAVSVRAVSVRAVVCVQSVCMQSVCVQSVSVCAVSVRAVSVRAVSVRAVSVHAVRCPSRNTEKTFAFLSLAQSVRASRRAHWLSIYIGDKKEKEGKIKGEGGGKEDETAYSVPVHAATLQLLKGSTILTEQSTRCHRQLDNTVFPLKSCHSNIRHSLDTCLNAVQSLTDFWFSNICHIANNSTDIKGIPILCHKKRSLVAPQSSFLVSCLFVSYTQKTTSKHIH